jgi:predicted TIM-barrel enzyme
MASEVLPVVHRTPVLAGVDGTPIRSCSGPSFLCDLADMGFSGIQNFPSVDLFDGTFQADLEETGRGCGPEVDLVRAARVHDLSTTPLFSPGRSIATASMVRHPWSACRPSRP